MRFDALLPCRPPRCLSIGRAHGVRFPSELDQSEITAAFRQRYPLLRLAVRRPASRQLTRKGHLKATLSPRTPTYPRRFRGWTRSVRRRSPHLSAVTIPGSGSSTGHSRTARAVPKNRAASLQGFEPSDGWDTGVRSPCVSMSWLSWVSPSLWPSPSPVSAFRPPFGYFVEGSRSGYLSLYFKVSKNQGCWLVSSETAGHFEVFVLVPSSSFQVTFRIPFRVQRRISDRPSESRRHVHFAI